MYFIAHLCCCLFIAQTQTLRWCLTDFLSCYQKRPYSHEIFVSSTVVFSQRQFFMLMPVNEFYLGEGRVIICILSILLTNLGF